jgi:UDP-galactopyranose mutase
LLSVAVDGYSRCRVERLVRHIHRASVRTYPFQNNIKYLSKETVLECLLGLIEAQKQPLDKSRFKNFEELMHGAFGAGIVKHFMMPYNFKVWAHPPCLMNKEWIGERVSTPSIERVLGNVVLDREDVSWGLTRHSSTHE